MPFLGRPLGAAVSTSGLMPLLLAVAVLIVTAKLMAALSSRLGQPAILGELLAGLLLGPTVLDLFRLPLFESPTLSQEIHTLGQIGVLLLMFAAGLETELDDLRQAGRPALLGGVFGVLGPIVLVTATALLFDIPAQNSIFLGITLAATSVSISAQTLLEVGRLRTREGAALLGAAVVDDILEIVILAIFLVLVSGSGGLAEVLRQVGTMGVVLAVAAGLAIILLPRLAEQASRLPASEGLLAVALAAMLVLAWLTEYVGGVAAITGAFLAGVGLRRSHLRDEIEQGLHRVAYGFFVPLFLTDIGLQSNVRLLDSRFLLFSIPFILVAILSKVLGSGLGARLAGFDRSQALRLGLGMVSRGEVGLIVAAVGLAEGLLSAQEFALVVLAVLVTTLITPILLRWAVAREEVARAAAGRAGGTRPDQSG